MFIGHFDLIHRTLTIDRLLEGRTPGRPDGREEAQKAQKGSFLQEIAEAAEPGNPVGGGRRTVDDLR